MLLLFRMKKNVILVFVLILILCALGVYVFKNRDNNTLQLDKVEKKQEQVMPLAMGLNIPWGIDVLPNGNLLVTERATGKILEQDKASGALRELKTVEGVDISSGEGGLLGIAVSPDYESDKLVFVYFTSETDNRIVAINVESKEQKVMLSGIKRANIHNGGRIAFGPDGYLYAGTGDAAETALSQNPNSLNGKILRMSKDGRPAPGNPFGESFVYSIGHRNVQGLAWDRAGRLWATEFGQRTTDEVNLIEPGKNYGWPIVEGNGDTQGGKFTNPKVTWQTNEASPSGAAIIGDTLYVAALRGQRIWRVPLNGENTGTPEILLQNYGRIRTIVATKDGELLFSTSNRDQYGRPGSGDDKIFKYKP